MRYLIVLLLLFPLSGCWFIYIPGSMFQRQAPDGNTCIQAGYFEGDRIKHAESGRIGIVKKRYGESPRCAQATYPILADVEYQ